MSDMPDDRAQKVSIIYKLAIAVLLLIAVWLVFGAAYRAGIFVGSH